MKRTALCASLILAVTLLTGATIRIPPARVGPIRVQSAGVVSTGTGTGTAVASAAPSLGLSAAYYQTASASNYAHPAGQTGYWLDSSGNGHTLTATSDALSPASASGVLFHYAVGESLVTALSRSVASPTTVVIKFDCDTGYSTDSVCSVYFYYGSHSYVVDNAGGSERDYVDTGATAKTIVVRATGSPNGIDVWANGIHARDLTITNLYAYSFFQLGRTGAGAWCYGGTIYGCLIYSRALSDAECADSVNWF